MEPRVVQKRYLLQKAAQGKLEHYYREWQIQKVTLKELGGPTGDKGKIDPV